MATRSLVTAIAFLLAALLHAQASPDVDAVLERLDAYLDTYESQLSAVVADERLIQETEGRFQSKQRRRLDSDVAFLRLPGNREWLGFRSVTMIDGEPLVGGQSLTELLTITTADAMAQAKLLVEASSKHNLGNPRTVNIPNLPLEMLGGKYRHRYAITVDGRTKVRGHAVDVLELVELGPPPIVYNGGYDLQSRLRAWIDAQTGALWRAEVVMKGKAETRKPSKVRVEFAEDRNLKVLVPIEMREEFSVTNGSGRGVATYSNFRRFQTSARIVPPPP
ncbi:MAG: hypothetical protein WC815_19755 [Vicinamibacterales bacterium]|jgi:hypothetical protein